MAAAYQPRWANKSPVTPALFDRNLREIAAAIAGQGQVINDLRTGTININASTSTSTTGATVPPGIDMGGDFDQDSGSMPSVLAMGARARFWISAADPGVPYGVDMGALGSGVLQHVVTAGISAPNVFAVGSTRIPFGSGTAGGLADSADMTFTGGVLKLGTGSSSAQLRVIAPSGDSAIGNFWKDASATKAVSFGNGISGSAPTDDAIIATFNGASWSERLRARTSDGAIVIGIGTVGAKMSIIDPNNLGNFAQVTWYPNSGTNVTSLFAVSPRGTGSTTTNRAALYVMNTDYVADSTNYELCGLRSVGANGFVLATGKNGTGANQPLMLAAGWLTNGITNNNQLLLNTTGTVQMSSLTGGGVVQATSATGVLSAVSISGAAIAFGSGVSGGLTSDIKLGYLASELFLGSGLVQTWYNVDGPANYERVRAFWTGGTWTLKTEATGSTGVVRSIAIDASTAFLTLSGAIVTVGGTQSTLLGVAGTTPTVGISSNPPGAGFSQTVNVDSSQTVASHASLVWRGFTNSGVLTITGATNVTTTEGVNAAWFQTPTLSGSGTAKTVTNAATVAIAGVPVGASGVTITNAYALWVQSGSVRIDGAVALGGGAAATLGTIGATGPTAAAQAKWIPLNSGGTQYWVPAWA